MQRCPSENTRALEKQCPQRKKKPLSSEAANHMSTAFYTRGEEFSKTRSDSRGRSRGSVTGVVGDVAKYGHSYRGHHKEDGK